LGLIHKAGRSASHSPCESLGDEGVSDEDDDLLTLPPPFELERYPLGRLPQIRRRLTPSDRPTVPAPAPADPSPLPPTDRIPRLVVPLHELKSLSLDPESGFVLSRIDGISTIETLLDVSAMPRFEALRLVARLVDFGVIELAPSTGCDPDAREGDGCPRARSTLSSR
jgi:hypothetical protein